MDKKKGKTIKLKHILFLVLGIYLCSTLIKQHTMIKDLKGQKIEKEQEIEALHEGIATLQDKIEHADSLEYIERLAREELKMVKPNEIIVIDKNKVENKFSDNFNQ